MLFHFQSVYACQCCLTHLVVMCSPFSSAVIENPELTDDLLTAPNAPSAQRKPWCWRFQLQEVTSLRNAMHEMLLSLVDAQNKLKKSNDDKRTFLRYVSLWLFFFLSLSFSSEAALPAKSRVCMNMFSSSLACSLICTNKLSKLTGMSSKSHHDHHCLDERRANLVQLAALPVSVCVTLSPPHRNIVAQTKPLWTPPIERTHLLIGCSYCLA